ncbi:uncharacterized protein SRS1_16559 [Sporisorium reilianum f. sp. reilianum]|uniref:Uncharacterized protein n=1 Tax=Sporisorium reilianum f. sp. reilianum TaxID=72559 RepID=A0A2N8UD64_9BASI|nr:uncharacterized protein SRS1_16559 [Sporisorium reilianum f. sp. reilianum]
MSQRRFLALVLAFVTLFIYLVSVAATEQEMIEAARSMQKSAHTQSGLERVEAGTVNINAAPGWPQAALRLARDRGARYVGAEQPVLGETSTGWGPLRKTIPQQGEAEHYFYSYIHSSTLLGQLMELQFKPTPEKSHDRDKVAVVLWKQKLGEETPTIVHIDLVKETSFGWWHNHMQNFETVMRTIRDGIP